MNNFNPDEILNQLTQSKNGANRLATMTGAKNFNFTQSSKENSVSFKLPRGVFVKIKLNAMDLYDMEFGKIRKFEYKVIKEFKGLYSDMLKETFEQHTKLYLSL